jgi:hypothetical protein
MAFKDGVEKGFTKPHEAVIELKTIVKDKIN